MTLFKIGTFLSFFFESNCPYFIPGESEKRGA